MLMIDNCIETVSPGLVICFDFLNIIYVFQFMSFQIITFTIFEFQQNRRNAIPVKNKMQVYLSIGVWLVFGACVITKCIINLKQKKNRANLSDLRIAKKVQILPYLLKKRSCFQKYSLCIKMVDRDRVLLDVLLDIYCPSNTFTLHHSGQAAWVARKYQSRVQLPSFSFLREKSYCSKSETTFLVFEHRKIMINKEGISFAVIK